MRVGHFIPLEEGACHDCTAECACGPAVVRQELLGGELGVEYDLILEHQPFGLPTDDFELTEEAE